MAALSRVRGDGVLRRRLQLRDACRPAPAARAAPVAGDRLIDVGGHRLNIRCIGSGSPTVVLEPGLGESASAIARRIAPEVARTTRVCVYDRAGHGRSDVAPDADAARDLHVLLERAHVPGPYVMAGHSLGGMFVLSYAHRYPSQVGGVVLLDSMHPHQTHTAASGMGPVLGGGAHARADRPRSAARRPEGRRADGTSPTVRARRRADARPAEPGGAAHEPRQTAPWASSPPARAPSRAGPRTRTTSPRCPSNSFHRTVAGSTHQSLIDDPKDAAASSRAIRDVVVAVAQRASREVPGDASLSPPPRDTVPPNAGPCSPRSPATTARCVTSRPSARARFGGHAIWWDVNAASEAEALQLLPSYIAQRTTVVAIADVEIP